MELINFIYLIFGIILLYYGGEWILNATLSFAQKAGIPKVFSAVVLTGFGTSASELFVSFSAVLNNAPSVALGNVLGSNVANILLVGSLGMIMSPIVKKMKYVGYESIFIVLSGFVPLVACLTLGMINFTIGLLLVIGLIVYFYLASIRPNSDEIDEDIETMTYLKIFVIGGVGLVFLLSGSQLLVFGAVNIANALGISQAIIGISVVAIGTSLPEIATAIASARRGQGELIVGNILGSNIFNIMMVLGGVSLYQNIHIDAIEFSDSMIRIPIITLLLVALIYFNKLNKAAGYAGLTLYGFYVYSWTM